MIQEKADLDIPPLELIKWQRSHVLFVLSEPRAGLDGSFLSWYQGVYRRALTDFAGVLSVQHYEQHEVDITQGQYAPLPFRYLGLVDVSLDGAAAASDVIDRISALHEDCPAASPPAIWIYYPASEKVGRSPAELPSMLTLAFANGISGQEADFREWYATRHIRHALNIPALVSGQCLERAQFQRPSALQPAFKTIAVYEQERPPEDIIASFNSLPEALFDFPTMDTKNFAEWVYRPLNDIERVTAPA